MRKVREGLEGVRLNELIRSPYRERKISEISPEDGRVRILATVVEVGEADLVVADETGTITCLVDNPSLLKDIRPGSVVRIFGFPLRSGEIRLQADIIQRMDGLNVHLYREVQREISRLEEELKW